MKTSKGILKTILISSICFLFSKLLVAQDLSEKANVFLETLSEDLKAKALFSLDDAERYNMNYVPLPRKGPTYHDFDSRQKQAANDLIMASLSEQGFEKTEEIRELESVLRSIENDDNDKMPDGRPRRDPLNYHFCLFGTPSSTDIWGWRFEGHHISLNFTSDNGNIVSSTPSFMGSNPGIVRTGEHKGKEVLKKESDLGFKLVNSLTKDQLKKTIFSEEAPYEILSENFRKVDGVEKVGIPYTELTPDQRKTFMQLLDVYIGNYIFEFSETFRKKIMDAGIENLNFAWAGSLKQGVANYYRIHGPMLLIEFDNTQNNANHMHTAVRDLTNDYAEDILRQHYELEHQ